MNVLLALALLAGPQDVDDYARREAKELEEFRGGFEGGVLILIGIVIGGLILTAASDCELCERGHVEELPAWEGPPPPSSRESPRP